MTRKNKLTSRRHISAFCFFILLFSKLNAQRESDIRCSLVKQFTLGIPSLENRFSVDIQEGVVYFLTQNDNNQKERKLIIHKISIENDNKDSLIINYPSNISIQSIPKFSISKDYLILIDDERSKTYRFVKKENTYTYLNQVKLPKKYAAEHVRFLNKNQFLFTSIYNYHPNDNYYNSNLAIYDAENDAYINVIHPDLPCIGFSHLTSSWITNCKSKIAVANPCGYKIFLYDTTLNLIDSIDFKNPDNWKDFPENKIPFETDPSKIHPKILIDKLLELNDSISRIEKIFFLDENTLLVSSNNRKNHKESKRMDLWNIGKNPKLISTYENNSINFHDNDTINLRNLPFTLNSPEYYSIFNYIFYTIDEEDKLPENNIMYKDFKYSKDLYYENHDPHYSIGIYKIIIP